MPTGYTYMINDKKATFPQFVWACARAFGALVMMRDEPSGAPIRKEKPSSHHDDSLRDARKELADLKAMTVAKAEAQAEKEFRAAMKEHEAYLLKKAEERNRYQAMLEQVQAWTPPTKDHEGLKKFMVQQITESIDFDCGGSMPAPKKLTGKEWLARKEESIRWSIEYHEEHARKERERIDGRNQWVEDLAKSVPMPKELL